MSVAPHDPKREKFNRIMRLVQAGDLAGAQALLEPWRRLEPREPNLLNLAAWLAGLQGAHGKAVALYKQLLAHNPAQPQIRFNLHRAEAIAAEQQEDLTGALAALQQAQTIMPQDAALLAQIRLIERQLCIFMDTPLPGALLSPAAMMVLEDDPARQRANAEAWARQQFGGIATLPPVPPRRDGPLRLGFLTSDLHEHATAYLIAEFFERLDRARFTPCIYSYGVVSNAPVRHRIMAAAQFQDVAGQPAAAVAQRLRDDAVDIAIDLKGYTRGGRLDILAYRPAPLQMHWLGFPGTLGCSFIDYFIADPVVLPPALAAHFSEQIITLPDSYQCNDRERALPPPLPRRAYGLPEDALVFASLNQTYKLHPALLRLWAAILHDTPGSVLWLLASNNIAPDSIRSFLAQEGIDAARLHFAPPVGQQEHLQRYHAVDIALDTFPIGGHTTTSDALWLGVPVVTLAGPSFVSRVAASLLSATGQQALIAQDEAGYQARAVQLTRDPARRAAIKAELTAKRLSWPLFDSEKFVKNFMAGLELAWARQRQGLPPQSLRVPAGL